MRYSTSISMKHRMARTGLILAGWILLPLHSAHFLCADEPAKPIAKHKAYAEPKICFVHTAKASVRCGPDNRFYATMILEHGASVEVYLETSDGWSAIRPPDGSHNWIPSDAVYLLPGGKSAEVSVDRAVAFIGSDASEIESLLFQTELVKSQRVTILGEAQREEDGKSTLWFRIAPPQGEFRWIRTSQLGTDPVTKQTSPVQLASHTESSTSEDPTDEVKPASGTIIADGQVVWSDKAEQIARIEQEIEREQAELSADGPVTEGLPIPTMSKKVKTPRVNAMEQDAQYWNALQGGGGQPMKVGPVSGVLGWLGFSIVEDGMTAMPPSPHGKQPSGPLSRRGPYMSQSPLIENRLDRLPRPSRKYGDGSWWSTLKSQGPLFGQDPPGQDPDFELNAPESEYSESALAELAFSGPAFAGPINTATPRPAMDYPIAAATYQSSTGLQPMATAEMPDKFQTAAIQDALVQLTAMVAKPTEQWNLEPFRVSAKSWVELGDSPLVRGEARLLLDRIEEFESLRRRSMSLQPAPMPNAAPITEAVPRRVAESGSDTSGWLVSVHTSVPGQPEFALTDDAGNVLAYVRPTTGLNLRRYVQQPVTVYGMPGYIPNLAAKQIIAERVVRLR